MFGLNKKERLLRAIKKDDLEAFKALLDRYPEELPVTVEHEMYGRPCTALHAAAYHDSPNIIAFLVNEKKMDVSLVSTRGWMPIHSAAKGNAFEAAKKLIELGANPLALTQDGKSPFIIASSGRAEDLFRAAHREKDRIAALALQEAQRKQELLDKEAEKKAQQRREKEEAAKKAGRWVLSPASTAEVIFGRTLPVNACRLTEIFNFETRRWISITETQNGHVAQNDRFFDDVTDKEILKIAYARLIELGGKADPDVIDHRPVNKPKPAHAGGP